LGASSDTRHIQSAQLLALQRRFDRRHLHQKTERATLGWPFLFLASVAGGGPAERVRLREGEPAPDLIRGCRSEHRFHRWPEGRAPWMARVFLMSMDGQMPRAQDAQERPPYKLSATEGDPALFFALFRLCTGRGCTTRLTAAPFVRRHRATIRGVRMAAHPCAEFARAKATLRLASRSPLTPYTLSETRIRKR